MLEASLKVESSCCAVYRSRHSHLRNCSSLFSHIIIYLISLDDAVQITKKQLFQLYSCCLSVICIIFCCSRTAKMVVSMATIDDHERKVCSEFAQLLEQSKTLFNGLRDLPQCGQKIWQGYFGRTFDVYTKLWKYQQQHRHILDRRYGLKRWQIGEIASKIGQLYYHYYLRTSDINNLWEAYSFYSAIRSRQYYSRASQEDRSELMVKKLRYYARFIVVCLLMRKMKVVDDLLHELDMHIVDYTSTYEPDDQMEWSVVLQEIKSFVAADTVVNILHADQNTIVLSHRLTPHTTPPVERSSAMTLTLQEIILIGNVNDQVKYSEMTIDMFRMIQTLEREKRHEDFNHTSDPPSRASFEKSFSFSSTRGYYSGITPPYTENFDRGKRENPHKYVLYKPSITQIMMFLATGFKELPANGVLLMYISADGCFPLSKNTDNSSYDMGGVITSCRKEIEIYNKGLMHVKEIHCLYPGDLHPFTRKPLFLIVDSDNSFAFQHIHQYFGHPFVVLMSPQDVPDPFQGYHRNGNLFTLFLHSPLTAVCLICNINSLPIQHWERCQSVVDRFISEASALFTRSAVDPAYLQFFGDDFLRLIILRYIFCYIVLRNHEIFKSPDFRPKCHPALPESELLDHPVLQHLVYDLASHLDVRNQFVNTNPQPHSTE
ncbi:protein SCAI [Planococcus citri]|uniref:protein SCAI n=1 Tax=Planococcus citri TaxID=170843 RepID=UPI0031F8D13A